MDRLKLLLAMLMISVLSAMSLASDVKVLKVGVPENFSPFYYRDELGEFHGASYDILSAVAQNLGYQLKTQQYPSMQLLLAEMGMGHVDINPNLTATPERSKVALFTQTPHIFETQNIITRADTSINFNGRMLQLAPYQIGVNFGWTYGEEFDSADFLNKVYKADSVAQLKGLLSGEYDIAINNRQFFMETAAQLNAGRAFKVVETPVYRLPVTIAVSKSYPDAATLTNLFEAEVVKFKTTPAYREILTRYGFQSQLDEAEGAL